MKKTYDSELENVKQKNKNLEKEVKEMKSILQENNLAPVQKKEIKLMPNPEPIKKEIAPS